MVTFTPKLGLHNPEDPDDANDAVRVWRAADNAILDDSVAGGMAGANLLSNPGLELWSLGPGPFAANQAIAADRWRLSLFGTSTLSVGRDAANADAGSGYCAACVYAHNAESTLNQTLDDYAQLRGRTLTLALRVKTTAAGAARAAIYDSVNLWRHSAYHSGGGAYETLIVSAPIDPATTTVAVALRLGASGTVYLDAATLVAGAVAAPYAPLHPVEDQARSRPAAERYVVAPQLNQLVNGGFEVWQRGTGPFTSSGNWTADRWLAGISVSTYSLSRIASTIGSGGYSVQVTYTHSGAGFFNLYQPQEGYLPLRGRPLALGMVVKSTVAGRVRIWIWDPTNGYVYSPYNVGTGAETLTVVATPSAGASGVTVGIGIEAGSCTVEINDATLVVGSIPADYQPLAPADDLGRCQRYYQVIGGIDATEYALVLQCWTTTGALGVWRFVPEMAITPTLGVSAGGDWGVTNAAGAVVACTAVSFASATRRSAQVAATVAAGLVAGNATILVARSTLAARLYAEANP